MFISLLSLFFQVNIIGCLYAEKEGFLGRNVFESVPVEEVVNGFQRFYFVNTANNWLK